MTLGPLDYVVVGFPGNQFKGEIAPAINDARAKGIIRIVDLVFVMKDKDGAVTTLEIKDLPDEIKDAFAAFSEEVDGLFTAEDIATLTDTLPPDNSALIILFENTWAVRIKQAFINANGVLITQGRIPQELQSNVEEELEAHIAENEALRTGGAA